MFLLFNLSFWCILKLRYRQFEHGQQLLEQALLRQQNKIHYADLELISELGSS